MAEHTPTPPDRGDRAPDPGDPGPDRAARAGRPGRGELVEAEVEPLELNGIRTVVVGTAAWAVAFLVLLVFRDELARRDAGWWLWVPLPGFVLGLLGLAYCRRRWTAIRADLQATAGSPQPSASSDESSSSGTTS